MRRLCFADDNNLPLHFSIVNLFLLRFCFFFAFALRFALPLCSFWLSVLIPGHFQLMALLVSYLMAYGLYFRLTFYLSLWIKE